MLREERDELHKKIAVKAIKILKKNLEESGFDVDYRNCHLMNRKLLTEINIGTSTSLRFRHGHRYTSKPRFQLEFEGIRKKGFRGRKISTYPIRNDNTFNVEKIEAMIREFSPKADAEKIERRKRDEDRRSQYRADEEIAMKLEKAIVEKFRNTKQIKSIGTFSNGIDCELGIIKFQIKISNGSMDEVKLVIPIKTGGTSKTVHAMNMVVDAIKDFEDL